MRSDSRGWTLRSWTGWVGSPLIFVQALAASIEIYTASAVPGRDPADPIAGFPGDLVIELGPDLAVVPGDPDVAVVRAGPEEAGDERRFVERRDGAVLDFAVAAPAPDRELG